jgi:uncharacterized protein (TIGR02266 family)
MSEKLNVPRPDATTAEERRKHPRLQISVDVRIESGHYFYGGRTRDLSEGGLFIECDVKLPPGTELTVDLRIPGMHAPLPAEVMWMLVGEDGAAHGFGVRFTSMSHSQQRLLQAFLVENGKSGIDCLDDDPDEPEVPRGKGPPPLPRS